MSQSSHCPAGNLPHILSLPHHAMTAEETKMKDEAFNTVRVFIMNCGPRTLDQREHVTALDLCDFLTDLFAKPWMTLDAKREALDLHAELMAITRRSQWQ